jgi:Asp-tRNA(Asn)/Glu-tRNA(Gln) amidotransferase A subunit family amidase
MILWLNHPGITRRSVMDVGLVLDVLAERREHRLVNYARSLTKEGKPRVGVAKEIEAEEEMLMMFKKAIETVSSLGHSIDDALVPLWRLSWRQKLDRSGNGRPTVRWGMRRLGRVS